MMATYEAMQSALVSALAGMELLANEGPFEAGQTWRVVAVQAARNFDALAAQLREAASGHHEPFIRFPGALEAGKVIEK